MQSQCGVGSGMLLILAAEKWLHLGALGNRFLLILLRSRWDSRSALMLDLDCFRYDFMSPGRG